MLFTDLSARVQAHPRHIDTATRRRASDPHGYTEWNESQVDQIDRAVSDWAT